ncbi:MAG TPA: SAM-dependent methyltransferase [Nitrospira sp.]|nr:SAM-dependent methyltransferase [Nitrospira sp.]
MGRQKSKQTSRDTPVSEHRRGAGTLFVVGTPIGCPDDLTLRARMVLDRVSIIVAETPLVTRTLLDHHGIPTSVTSYAQGDEEKIAILLDRLNAGHDLALVCDSGMPVIYDPGRLLIAAARAAGHAVTVIPGASALTTAAALSGESADRLLFVGRLPSSAQQLDRLLKSLRREVATVVMFALPEALPRILTRIDRILADRRVTLAVNLTRPDERLSQGRAGVLLDQLAFLAADSEVTLVLSGALKGRRKLTGGGS